MRHRTSGRVLLLALLCGGGVLILGADARGQSGPRSTIRQSYRDRPRVSPYTSLINNGSTGVGLNYYNIVRPRQQAQRTARRMATELRSVESNVKSLQRPQGVELIMNAEALTTGRMSPTGHLATFGATGIYYSGLPVAR